MRETYQDTPVQAAILNALALELAARYTNLSINTKTEEYYAFDMRKRVEISQRHPFVIGMNKTVWKSVRMFTIFFNNNELYLMRLSNRYAVVVPLDDPNYLDFMIRWMFPHWFKTKRRHQKRLLKGHS